MPHDAIAQDALTTPGLDRIELPMPDRPQPLVLWVHRPAGYGPGQKPPLVVCLHGTDDTAEQMVAFWRERRTRFNPVIAAPQGIGKGWSSQDVAAIRAAFAWLANHVWYDRHRLSLAGWSAGGAMTFQMIYTEDLPVTAAIALANYVPPRLTADAIRPHRALPVFYAVGMADVNHELMRAGLDYLRAAGANVELYHPTIGHILSPEVAQAAVDWLYDLWDRQTTEAIEKYGEAAEFGRAVERLEDIAAQPQWNAPAHVSRAATVIVEVAKPGEASLREAEAAIAEHRPEQAVAILSSVERTYGISRLGIQARHQRERLEADPLVRAQIDEAKARKTAADAMSEYANAQRLVSQNRLADAAAACHRIVERYRDTPAAQRAQRLLQMLEGRTSP